MVTQQYPSLAIKRTKESLYDLGKRIKQKTWQSTISPDDTWEVLNHHVSFIIPETVEKLKVGITPNLPWADMHFEERISGIPYNPPPSHIHWPFASKKNQAHLDETKKFSHTYPERFFPKFIDHEFADPPLHGIRYAYGDLNDLVELMIGDPGTRQAYLPIFFPEDTGAVNGVRVPCSLGYHFIIREGYLHMNYYIRSCDFIRHFNDDIYLACRLNLWIADRLNRSLRDELSSKIIIPGIFNMYITSLHCFFKERERLKK